MMSAFFHFQHTLNRLFNNCIRLYWYYISSPWNMKGEGSNWPPLPFPRRKLSSKSPALLGLNILPTFSNIFNSILIDFRGVFRTLSNICDGNRLQLKAVNYSHKKFHQYRRFKFNWNPIFSCLNFLFNTLSRDRLH